MWFMPYFSGTAQEKAKTKKKTQTNPRLRKWSSFPQYHKREVSGVWGGHRGVVSLAGEVMETRDLVPCS